ncbi:tripartite tricarboxylate transporter permease [Alloalcanivorax gelatiniphagus]|uniref:C4-dicarboxylate ABC transporter permease n=1 Tax=Alloalcanivorax gelatiniphagus TaxID=1194167 RepID=A0ABY2XP09_9GAMM|nr:tripartite tricarboxylate transporter permease [Alloalcanivorax gelatiniphagus]TMW14199.1 C4-dicarboxylate ABC transporter permease [Alloalcanivorax gelatiniphagus]|tara:strand:- start:382 stop:1893 length:1512 start_codon:yes stop_codon:yes gene_type:complete
MLTDFLAALGTTLLSPWGLVLAVIGTLLGILLGAMPGVSSTMALAILLPISFGMDPHLAILFLLTVFVASVYGGSVTAILINIPGTPGSIVTQLDGYPMARSGRAGQALTYALVSSTLGGLIGLVALVLVAPLLAAAAMKFRSPEFTAVAVFGLVLLAYASPGSTIRGMMVGGFGLLCGMVGFDKLTDIPRFTFDSTALQGGIELVPLCVGLFGFAEVLKNVGAAGRSSAKGVMPTIGKIWPPMKELLSHWKTMLRGSLIGAGVGAIPAAGSAIAVAIAYAQEMRFSKRPEKFGTGVSEGVVAPESANSSSIGGTLIPMMTLGIPGDAITAVLMGSLLIHGLRPGPGLFTSNPEFVSGVYSSFFLALILTLIVGLLLMRWVAWVTRIPSHILMVVIAVLCVVGSFAIRNTMDDVYIMLAFGVIGYLLNLLRLPAAPLAFGLILGPLLEENLRRSLILGRGSWEIFIDSPIALTLLLMSAGAILLPLVAPWFVRLRNDLRRTYR